MASKPRPEGSVDLNRLDLNLLVAFDLLMTEQSVTGAARRMSVTQSTMSATLARLRKLLDDPVLVRQGRILVPTPLAQALAGPVSDLLRRIQAVLSNVDTYDPRTDHREFSIMAGHHTTIVLLQPLLIRLNKEAPALRLRFVVTTHDFLERLSLNQIDLLITAHDVTTSKDGFHREVIYQDRLVLVVDGANPEVGESITLEQFSTLPYLAVDSDLLPSISQFQLNLLGVPRHVRVTTSFGIAPFLLRNTNLITLLPERLAKRVASAEGLRLLEPPMELLPVTETMIWTNRHDTDPAHTWLREQMRSFARDHFGALAAPPTKTT